MKWKTGKEANYKERFEELKRYILTYRLNISADAAVGCLVTWAYYEGKTDEDDDYQELLRLCDLEYLNNDKAKRR